MDASAFMSPDEWQSLLERLRLDEDRICEGRYDHVVHMVVTIVESIFYTFRLIELLSNYYMFVRKKVSDFAYFQVSAANGADEFYSVENNAARFEGLELARERDKMAMEAWREHPYVDIVDNRKSRDFDGKVRIYPFYLTLLTFQLYGLSLTSYVNYND